MWKLFLRNRIFYFFFVFFFNFGYTQEIRVCLWKGKEPYYAYENFKNYPGKVYLKKENGVYHIINEVDFEEYITGVVSKEMDENWPVEALKAQAVCSRTFFLWKKMDTKDKIYDIENSIYHQVYGVCKSEKIKKAVKETEGEILIDENGEIAKVFFHACCGGMTTNPEEIWGGQYPYNISIVDPYCKDSPYSSWEKTFSKQYLSKTFGFQIDRIEILERDKTGRVKILQILTKNGKKFNLTGHEFRLNVNRNTDIYFKNPYIIPSTMFEIYDKGKEIVFRGKGYGHGAGMCQWGARKMAESGYSYKEILNFYFPGLKIKKLTD